MTETERKQAWVERNRERVTVTKQAWVERNREHVATVKRAWAERHKGLVAFRNQKKHAHGVFVGL